MTSNFGQAPVNPGKDQSHPVATICVPLNSRVYVLAGCVDAPLPHLEAAPSQVQGREAANRANGMELVGGLGITIAHKREMRTRSCLFMQLHTYVTTICRRALSYREMESYGCV